MAGGQCKREGGAGEVDVVEAAQLNLALQPYAQHCAQGCARLAYCKQTRLLNSVQASGVPSTVSWEPFLRDRSPQHHVAFQREM